MKAKIPSSMAPDDYLGEIEKTLPEESPPDEFETVKRDMIDELEEMEDESERDILEVYLKMLEGKFEGHEVGLGPLDMPKEKLMWGLHDFIEDVGEPPSVVQYKSSRYWKGADRPLTQLYRELHDDGESSTWTMDGANGWFRGAIHRNACLKTLNINWGLQGNIRIEMRKRQWCFDF